VISSGSSGEDGRSAEKYTYQKLKVGAEAETHAYRHFETYLAV
jgi:hypothetical protein